MQGPSHPTTVVTDTATICVFDLGAMTHRIHDVGDWWSIPAAREAEIKCGNALFLNVGDDGVYQVHVTGVIDPNTTGYCLAAPSGRVFIGPGEEMSGAGFQPTGEWGGFFVQVEKQHQKVTVGREGDRITINLQGIEPFENGAIESVRI